MAGRSQPLSIESLLQKQKEEKEAAAKVFILIFILKLKLTTLYKPRFLTKEQRAQLAIQKRAQEIHEQREKEEKARKDRDALEREAEEIRSRERERERSSRYGGGGGGRCAQLEPNRLPLQADFGFSLR